MPPTHYVLLMIKAFIIGDVILGLWIGMLALPCCFLGRYLLLLELASVLRREHFLTSMSFER